MAAQTQKLIVMIIIDKTLYLVNFEYLHVITIEGRTGNLALTTYVNVNTLDNKCDVKYAVQSWNDHKSHEFIKKSFTDYSEANSYYNEIYNKYKA